MFASPVNSPVPCVTMILSTPAGRTPVRHDHGSHLISAASGVKAGQTVLVSGAVGRVAVRTARDKGAIVIAGVRKKQLGAAKSIGADLVVALDDQVAVDALAPVEIVANTVSSSVDNTSTEGPSVPSVDPRESSAAAISRPSSG